MLIVDNVNVFRYNRSTFAGKVNCGRYSSICSTLGVNSYPMWGIFKTGGAFELYHGKNTFNEIVKFVYSSIKAVNVWTLTVKQVTSILEGTNDSMLID